MPSAKFTAMRARILDAATILLAEKGLAGTTLQEVAAALSLKTTSITYYFRRKEDLAAEVFTDTIDRIAEMARKAQAEPQFPARLARYVDLHLETYAAAARGTGRPLALLSDMRALEEPVRTPLVARYLGALREVRRLFGEAHEPLHKRRLTAQAQVLNEALFWSTSWLRAYALGDLASVRRRFIDILAAGILQPGKQLPNRIATTPAGAGEAIRDDFLAAAARLINAQGYRGASIDRIASEIAVTKGGFYHHLTTKEEMIVECFRSDYRRLHRIYFAGELDGAAEIVRLASFLATVLDIQFEGRHPLLRTTALQAMPQAAREVALDRFQRTAMWLAGLLVDGMAEGGLRIVDPLISANLIISTLNAANDVRGWADKQGRGNAVAVYLDILFHGLTAMDDGTDPQQLRPGG